MTMGIVVVTIACSAIGQAHAQETAKIAFANCTMEFFKQSKSIGDNNKADYIRACMTTRGFSYNYRGCPTGYDMPDCYVADEKPGLIDRVRRAIGF